MLLFHLIVAIESDDDLTMENIRLSFNCFSRSRILPRWPNASMVSLSRCLCRSDLWSYVRWCNTAPTFIMCGVLSDFLRPAYRGNGPFMSGVQMRGRFYFLSVGLLTESREIC